MRRTAKPGDRHGVALRKESVDRNEFDAGTALNTPASLSARRAWIEIAARRPSALRNTVALRKESVDRNVFGFGAKLVHSVALRKESVDRNYQANAVDQILPGSLSARRAWIEISIVARIYPR